VIQKHTWKPSAATRANIVSACVNCSSFKVRSLYLHQPPPPKKCFCAKFLSTLYSKLACVPGPERRGSSWRLRRCWFIG
jgi:hypothetical protein